MNEVISIIESVAVCDASITKANERLTELMFKKGVEEHRLNKLLTTKENIAEDLAKAIQELDAVNTQLLTMPEGPEKEELITEQYRLMYRKRSLAERANTDSITSMVESWIEIGMYNGQIDPLTANIAELETKKAELMNKAKAA